MKNKSVHSCRFVHHAKFYCIMTTLNKLFKIKFERGETGKEPASFLGVTSGWLFSTFEFESATFEFQFPNIDLT